MPASSTCNSLQIECFQNAYDQAGNINGFIKTCGDSRVGCNISCDTTWEVKCTDTSGHSYCERSSRGCPVTCGAGQKYCYGNTYNQAGLIIGLSTTCANESAGCGCNAQWEDRCTLDGDSYCVDKVTGCPPTCTSAEQVCYMHAFDSLGYIDWTKPANQSCHPLNGSCPCNLDHQELCIANYGSWCQTLAEGSCPLSCSASQRQCVTTSYTANGAVNATHPSTESCAPLNESCPCALQWEQQCTDSQGGSWCQSASNPCPLDCGSNGTCFDYSTGSETCATAQGCACLSNQKTCVEYSLNVCYTGVSSCPVICDTPSLPMLCNTYGYDSNGTQTYTEQCLASTVDFLCPVQCNATTAKQCGSGADAYCIPRAESCPVVCNASEREVFVDIYNAAGQIIGSNKTCLAPGASITCGDHAVRCTIPDGGQYCQPSSLGCPLFCDESIEKTCEPLSFTTSGDIDSSVAANSSCVNKSLACPCGRNSRRCQVVDEFGFVDEYCIPQAESCPVVCKQGEKVCSIWDHNTSGYPETYSERCVSASASCPCGRNAKRCSDPHGDFCLANRDFWNGRDQSCPIYCTDTEDSCFVPSFNANGGLLSMGESCVPRGGACDCSRGQNAVACNRSTGGSSYVECIPRTGGFCPATCSAGHVTCAQLEDFSAAGQFLGSRAPSIACAANYSSCGCGLQAKQCTQGDFSWCIPRTLSCPVTCQSNEKKCFVYDFGTNGNWVSDREVCVAANASCPCGRNAGTCPGDDLCLPTADLQTECQCSAAEKQCDVEDFGADGMPEGFNSVCVAATSTCPCGRNALRCADPNDASENFCIPKSTRFGQLSCPTPCTPDQLSVNETCVQVNMDHLGVILSETITCVRKASCTPGRNMKRCPGGGVVHSSVQCVDLYGLADGNANTPAVSDGVEETAEVFLSIAAGPDAARGVGSAKSQVGNMLQLPSSLTLKMTMRTQAAPGGRRLQSTNAKLGFEFKNVGASAVSSEVAAGQLKKVFQTGELTSAVSAVGAVDTSKAPVVKTLTKQIKSRAAVAIEAGQTPPTPTPTPSPSPPAPTPVPSASPTPTPSPMPASSPTPMPLGNSTANSSYLVLTGSATLTVDNPTLFCGSAVAKNAFKAALVSQSNQPSLTSDVIDVTCTIVARRLGTTRRLAGDVTMSYRISLLVPAANLDSTNSSYTASMGAISATALGTAIVNEIPVSQTSLTAGLVVRAVTPPTSEIQAVVPMPTPTPTPTPTAPPTPAPAPSPSPLALDDGQASDASDVLFSFVGIAVLSLRYVL